MLLQVFGKDRQVVEFVHLHLIDLHPKIRVDKSHQRHTGERVHGEVDFEMVVRMNRTVGFGFEIFFKDEINLGRILHLVLLTRLAHLFHQRGKHKMLYLAEARLGQFARHNMEALDALVGGLRLVEIGHHILQHLMEVFHVLVAQGRHLGTDNRL